ncbi:MAG: hypothetical protein ACKO96_09770, partial [Flammeovirgaceae bacterium]
NFLSLLLENGLYIDIFALIKAVLLKPSKVICNQMQIITALTPNKDNSFLITSFTKSPCLLGVTAVGSACVHHKKKTPLAFLSYFYSLYFVNVKVISKLFN